MRCIYCNTPLSAIDYCTGCGADITIQKRIVRISNLLYNEGLEKALVRDVEGAIATLKRSLKFNKENIDARNLLGLCYMETGEIVSALCEWVVSKNMKPSDNLADHYLNMLQTNKNKLDSINQTIRKYNQSVQYCRDDNEDMAIIQLKKVIGQNPKFVKAYQLLALLYMKRQEYERARKLLRKAAHIDKTNTTTLRYLQEIEEATGKGTNLDKRHKRLEKDEGEDVSGTLRYMSGTEMIIQPTTFRDSSTIATFINIILGMLLGGAVVWFLIVPASRQNTNDEANRMVNEANTKLASESVKVQELEDEISGYQQQVEDANQERDDANSRAEGYEDLLAAANTFITGDESTAANMVVKLDGEVFENNALTLYNSLLGAVQSNLFQQYFSSGTTAYAQNDFNTAVTQLTEAVKSDPQRQQKQYKDALWYLAYAYYNLGNQSKAAEVFGQVAEYFPKSEYGTQARQYLDAWGIQAGSSGGGVQDTTAADMSGLGADAPEQTVSPGGDGTGNTGDAGAGDGTGAPAGDAGAGDGTGAPAGDAGAGDGTGAPAGDTGAGDGTGAPAGDTGAGDGIGGQDAGTGYGDGTWDMSDVAWTDPNTGLMYDMYGNMLPGQQ